MPAVRTAVSRQASISWQPLQLQNGPSHKHAASDIIELSSDDEIIAPKPTRRSVALRKSAKAKGKAKAVDASAADVLEISSGDERKPAPKRVSSSVSTSSSSRSSNALALQQHQIDPLKRENEKLKAELALTGDSVPRAEVEKRVAVLLAEQQDMLLSIEENITCEVCIEQMLTPYILTCGHTFCQPCLMDWFSTLLATFLQSNPGYDPHPPSARQYIQRARHPRVSAHQRQALQRAIRTLYEDNIKPTLTCPKCREALPSAPIECYALKGIAQSVAKASGKIRGDDAARRAAATRRSEGIWDGFFPQPPKIP